MNINRLRVVINQINLDIEKKGKQDLLKNKRYQRILKCSKFSLDDVTNDFDGYTCLYALINKRVEYITLIFSDSKADFVESSFYEILTKKDADNCEAVAAAKRWVRGYFSGKFKGYTVGH
jgi:hypothetical protein